MPTFNVQGRKKGPVTIQTVEAENRDAAIAQVVESAEEGEEFDVMVVEQAEPVTPTDPGAPIDARKK
jgi:hypothetical protein